MQEVRPIPRQHMSRKRADLTILVHVKQPKRQCWGTSRDFGWKVPESRKHSRSSRHSWDLLSPPPGLLQPQAVLFFSFGFCLAFERWAINDIKLITVIEYIWEDHKKISNVIMSSKVSDGFFLNYACLLFFFLPTLIQSFLRDINLPDHIRILNYSHPAIYLILQKFPMDLPLLRHNLAAQLSSAPSAVPRTTLWTPQETHCCCHHIYSSLTHRHSGS